MRDYILSAAENLALPIILLVVGLLILKNRPHFGSLLGYKTICANKSEHTWNRAQELFGRLCARCYAVMAIITLIGGIAAIVLRPHKAALDLIQMIFIIVNIVPLFVIIFKIEGTLKREFDKDGNPKVGDANEQ